jgi:glyoxylase I family protein
VFTGIHHPGIVVTDLDRAIDFYHGVLGLAFANEPTDWFEGPEIDEALNVAGARVRQVCFFLSDDGKQNLELLQYGAPESPIERPVPNNYRGASHVCFLVDDIVAAKAELERRGVKFNSDVNVVDEGPLAGWRWVYFTDPDGYALELCEVAYYNADERRTAIDAYLATR